ncbi:IQ domain-containing protein IQM2-like [Telopea speciosissima]|uniref:IQ domain-containing protein IQM2-like n=1 Tax=Telopea speciosissima TaxID=54955 RepID=UPI001CC3475B|nr:IQ domain-containing protein IQM2-like [Telopea speciosissima]
MGVSPDDLNDGFEAVIVKSISFDNMSTALRSVSFNGGDSDPKIQKSLGSGRMVLEGSVGIKTSPMETTISIKAPSSNNENKVFPQPVGFKSRGITDPLPARDTEKIPSSPLLDSGSPKHEAAVKLQKVYKSFRTRRKLADCAVLVEQQWWKLLDFAELKRSSISFFEIEKHETAISRWSRARTRAAKVGKGLSKDNKAQKLALQHWLEAIDPRHRYGHNLHFYYVRWLHCESREPFFYWLDIGEGKEVSVDKCPRSKLQQQCIKYLGPAEREAYEVVVENGRFYYKQTGKLLDTTEGPKDSKWIFVLSTSKAVYVGQKKKGKFQHSSFLAGGATSAAGRLVVENGILKAVWPHSGHYRPTEENFQEFVAFLTEHNVDLSDVKKCPSDDEEETSNKHIGRGFRSYASEEDLTHGDTYSETDSMDQDPKSATEPAESKHFHLLHTKLTNLEIPKRNGPSIVTSNNNFPAESSTDGNETAEESGEIEHDYMVSKRNLFEEDHEESEEEICPKELILQRINSHKEMKSYQLGKQLSCKWTTGAGPRIGCVRDYPSGLQSRVLERVNLSPRSARANYSPKNSIELSPKLLTPTTLCRKTTATSRSDGR